MTDFDLTTLRYFVAVCETRNIVHVGHRFGIVASAITKRLARLEAQMGQELLRRRLHGVEPTAAGLVFAEHAQRVLSAAQHLADEFANYTSAVTGSVTVIATSFNLAGRLIDDIGAFLANPQHKAINVSLEQRNSHDLTRAIQDNSAAIGIAALGNGELSGLTTYPYFLDKYAFATAKDHPLASKASLSLADCAGFDMIGLQSSRVIEAVFRRNGWAPDARFNWRAQVPSVHEGLRLASQGLGFFFTTFGAAQPLADAYGVVIRPFSDPWAVRENVICLSKQQRLSPAGQLLFDHLCTVAAT